jgi:hypothetical protein
MSKNRYRALPGGSSAYGYTGRPTSLNAMSPLPPIPRKRQKPSKAPPIKTESSVKSEIKDEPPPPVIPATIRRYKSGALISAPTSAGKRSGATVTRRALGLAASDTDNTDTGESAGEGESEGEGKGGGSGDPRGSEDLQDT